MGCEGKCWSETPTFPREEEAALGAARSQELFEEQAANNKTPNNTGFNFGKNRHIL